METIMTTRSRPWLAAALAAACTAVGGTERLGAHRRAITTSAMAAQDAFDAGLLYCYGFNHDEAVRCFERAAQLDPRCAMAQWGIAYALGPNINMPMTDAAVARRAHAAAQRAQVLAAAGTPVERALIGALVHRYADPPPDDRSALDRAYADAMRVVQQQFPDDADVAALFAEAMLDLAPWDQWTKDGKPKPGTEEIIAVLERTLARHPDHPLALHLYIHATEASPQPARALTAAARLPAVAPGLGHLVHMPAHTYQRVGRYREALRSNLDGAALDAAYFAASGPVGIYHAYHGHNLHFAAYSAMFLGDHATADAAARQLVATIPPDLLLAMPALFDGWIAVPQEVRIRFGRWQEVLAEPEPAERFPVARALHCFARGVALANLGDLDGAAREQQAFAAAVAAVPATATIGLTTAQPALEVARGMLAGELAFRSGDRARAFDELRKAVAAEDGLRYDEPPAWMMPVRHALGALLLEDSRYDEAEAVYRADLAQHPENGWSLHGLAECLRHGGSAQADAVAARFAAAWQYADVKLTGSCFCRR
jgi:tetratricopeptide (TPR) repeat protein